MKKLITYAFAFLSAFAVCGQNPADSAKVYFRISHRQYDPSLGDNRSTMDRFVDHVRKADAADDIHRLVVRAYASPDGQNTANIRLTGYRCDAIVDYLVAQTGINRELIQAAPEGIAWDELRALVAATPEVPSRDKVLDIIDNTPVWIFDEQGKVIDGRKKQLMALSAGEPYRWMFDNIFPKLRNAVAVSLYLKSDIRAARDAAVAAARAAAAAASDAARAAADASQAASNATADIAEAIRAAKEAADKAARAAAEAREAADRAQVAADQAVKASEEAAATDDVPVARSKAREAEDARMVAESAQAAAEASLSAAEAAKAAAEALALAEQPAVTETAEAVEEDVPSEPLHRFALKNNIIYDAALMPNLEFEWLINPHWSVAVEADVAWWSRDARHKYYQILAFQAEGRRWIKPRAPWHGMYVGVFAGGGKYDLENGDKGYKGEGGFGGVSFGYMFPISRCLSFDAEIGAGYMYTRYKEYHPYDGHYLFERTKTMNYFGPLRVKFALAWRFNDINKPKKVNPAL